MCFCPPLVRSQEQHRTGHRRSGHGRAQDTHVRGQGPGRLKFESPHGCRKRVPGIECFLRGRNDARKGRSTPDLEAAAQPPWAHGQRHSRSGSQPGPQALLPAAHRGPRGRGAPVRGSQHPDRVPGLCLSFSTVWVKPTASFQIILSKRQRLRRRCSWRGCRAPAPCWSGEHGVYGIPGASASGDRSHPSVAASSATMPGASETHTNA